MWLPYLGLAFAGILLVWWLSMPSAKEEAEAAAAAASASAAAAPSLTAVPAPAAPGGDPHAGHDHPHGGGPAGNLGNVKIAPAAEVNPHFKK
ncbi:MAG: hypothetical protein HYV09_17480 [Deltaproteobacteria bacterium]|nr:hypothetical protein [Deltaproteobacteria bacterium]